MRVAKGHRGIKQREDVRGWMVGFHVQARLGEKQKGQGKMGWRMRGGS